MDATPQSENADKGFVDDYLLYLLAAASEGASAEFHAHVRKTGLRVTEWRVLACLNDKDGAMITHLARLALVEQSRLTRIIAHMEEKGHVLRKNDPNDGRRVRVFLTDLGRALIEELVPAAQSHETSLLAKLAPENRAHLKSALRNMLVALGSSTEQADAEAPKELR